MKSAAIIFLAFTAIVSTHGLTHSEALARLTAEGITISSSGGCSDRNNRRCTSLDQIRDNTINGLLTLKRASRCPINVTGGTEVGHNSSSTKSHANGYKVDISSNRNYNCINNYIQNNFTPAGTRGDGAKLWKSAAGNVYAKEGNHWDILYI